MSSPMKNGAHLYLPFSIYFFLAGASAGARSHPSRLISREEGRECVHGDDDEILHVHLSWPPCNSGVFRYDFEAFLYV